MTANSEAKIVWQPLPGSQAAAISCPCNELLYEGSRGPGKTDAQVMFFRSHVGKGYGSYWRGIIFDRQYSSLEDLIAKSKRWFPEFGDGAKFLSSKGDLKWVWPTGEELLFRQITKEADYNKYHGHEYCLGVGSLVSTIKGNVAIEKLEIGDLVATPNGFKPITRIFPRKVKPCVSATTYCENGNLIGSQYQSENHRMLSNGLASCEELSGLSQIYHKLPETSPRRGASGKSSVCGHLKTLGGCDHKLEALDGRARISTSLFPNVLQRLAKAFASILLTPFLLLAYALSGKPIRRRIFSKSCEPSRERKEDRIEPLSCRVLPIEQPQSPIAEDLSAHVPPSALPDSDKESDFQWHCFADFGPHGELAQSGKEIFLTVPLLQSDALTLFQNHQMTDGGEREAGHNPPRRLIYRHPYTDERIESVREFRLGFVRLVACGEMETIDIEVGGENCYLTPCGLVNKNCFIGWNELTKFPNGKCYDIMKSCNRSGFLPLEHTPHKLDKDGNKIWLTKTGEVLPNIPLVIFSTTNPIGPGHNWVKKRFIDVAAPGEIVYEKTNVFDPRLGERRDIVKSKVRLFGSYKENRYLDPVYVASLENEKDPNRRKAWLHGDWNIVAGGALDDLWNPEVHVLTDGGKFQVPKDWQIDRAFDWGSTHPASVGWYALANGEEMILPNGETFAPRKGSIVRFAEWYLTNPDADNEGLKMSAGDIAIGILEREMAMMKKKQILTIPNPGPADNQIFQNPQSDELSIANKMKENGVNWTRSDKSAGSRINGLQLVRDRLEASIRGEGPGLYFTDACKHAISLLPVLPRDPDKPDDVDTLAEDHLYDEVRYRVLDGSKKLTGSLKTTYSQ